MRLLSSLFLAAVISASSFGSAAQQNPGTIPPSATPSVTQSRSPSMNRGRAARWFSEAVSFSPDGRSLGTVHHVGSRPGSPAPLTPSVVVWDLQTGRIRQELAGHAEGVTSLAFHPNSRWLAAGNQDRTVKVWDAEAGNELHTLRGHMAAVYAVAFTRDGSVASVSVDGVLKVWESATGRDLRTIPLGGPIQSATFSPDGSLLATRSLDPADTAIKLWDVAEGHQLRAIPAGAGSSMAFSSDRLLLAQADRNAHAIRIFEVATGRELPRVDLAKQPGTVNPFGFRTNCEFPPCGAPSEQPGTVHSLAFSPNGRWLAGYVENVLQVWEVDTGRETLPAASGALLGGRVTHGVAFSPDSQWLASTLAGGRLLGLFHIATQRELPGGRSELTLFSGNAGNVSQLAFLGDGHVLASVSGGDVRLWDSSTGQTIETVLNVGDGTPTCKLAFSPDGHLLAAAEFYAGDGAGMGSRLDPLQSLVASATGYPGYVAVRLWDLKSGKELRPFTISTQGKRGLGIASLAFSPDGHQLAAGGFNNIEVTDVETGREVRALVTGESPTEDVAGMRVLENSVMRLAFSGDGRRLVAVSPRSLQLWDSITGQRLAEVTERQFSSVILSSDGRWLAALRHGEGGNGLGVRLVLYEAATLHEVRSLFDFSEDPALLSFSADGRELAAIVIQPGSVTALKVWDTSTGQLLRTLPLYHERGVGATALSSDWQWLATVPQREWEVYIPEPATSRFLLPEMQTSVDLWEVSTGRHVRTLAGLSVRLLPGNEPPLKAQGAAPDYPPSEVDVLMSVWEAKRADAAAAPKGSSPRVRDAAISQYQRAVDFAPNNPELHFKLGAEFEARGAAAATSSASRPPGPALPEAARADYESALEQYRLAHQLAPDNSRYKEAFERLSRLLRRP